MVHGKLIPSMARFALPLMITSILQLLYNAADVIVVGKFAGSEHLAAVGSTGALINLIVNVFLGLSIGTNVIAARDYGAQDREGMRRTVHTSIAISLVGGVVLGIFGFVFGGTFLKWMDSPPEVLPLATVYIKIYFAGMPFNMLYNFGAAVLRAVGDTKRPLYFLTVAGIVNVVLNLVFVIVFHMGVAGVALATIISQAISAVLVVICLVHSGGYVHLDIRHLRIDREKLAAMARVGLPAGLQGALFSISNVLIQSTVNSYGAIVVAGNSAAQNIEGFIYASMNAFYQAAITFVSTNIGAGMHSRIRKSMGAALLLVLAVGVGMGLLVSLLMKPLLGIYSDEAAVIEAGIVRLRIFGITYFLCGLMDVLCGVLRGMGQSVVPMIVSILGVCAFRIFWIYVVLPIFPGREVLYMSYPVSWILTGGVHLICCFVQMRKFPVDPAKEALI
ncbi:MAG: MATE family efflux transporter [Clostridia bacterium]|nr:MATE family efflux transporter [Clostridia bacterium]